MTGPLVSIVTPSYNQGRWLADCLRSVAVQDYPHLEHVVMDGGSTDESVAILERAGSNVRWRSEADRGQSHALNKAYQASSGAIIGWVNSDDAYFHPQVVSEVVERFRLEPDIDVVYGHAALVSASGLVLQTLWVPPYHPRLLRMWNFLVQPSVFIRRSALGNRFLDEEYHSTMDRELWIRLAERSRYRRIDSILAIDRHYPERHSLKADAARYDHEQLVARYGIVDEKHVRVPVKLLKLGARTAGLRLMREATRQPLAFAGRFDGRALGRRQVLVRRASMPLD